MKDSHNYLFRLSSSAAVLAALLVLASTGVFAQAQAERRIITPPDTLTKDRAWPTFYETEAGKHWVAFSTSPRKSLSQILDPKPGGDSDGMSFIVFPGKAVDELAHRGVFPASEAQELRDDLADEGIDYRKSDDVFIVHLEALREVYLKDGVSNSKIFDDCFGWQDPETLSKTLDWNDQGEWNLFNIDEGAFQGDLDVIMPINALIDVTVTYQIKKKVCIPYKFRLIDSGAVGAASLNGSLILSGDFTYTLNWDWKERIFRYEHATVVWIGPLPVYLKFFLPVDIGFNASVKIAGDVELEAAFNAQADFDVICTSSVCDENEVSYQNNYEILDPTYALTLDADARLWAEAAIEMEVYDADLALFSVEAEGYAQAHLFGYIGNQCGDLDGDGEGDMLEDLLLDIDLGYSVSAHYRGIFGDRDWPLIDDLWHWKMRDLYDDSDGWNLTDPVVTGPSFVEAGQVASYEFRTRPCYPYADALNMQWQGPLEGSGQLIPGSKLNASGVPLAGTTPLEATATDDVHGREINNTTIFSVLVEGPGTGLQNGIPVGPLSGDVGSARFFYLDLPEGASDLQLTASGGTGDVQLYTRFGSNPSPAIWDCASTNPGNNEACFLPLPQAGRHMVLLDAAESYSGVSLTASFTEPPNGHVIVDVPESDLSGSSGSVAYFSVDVPPGATDLSFSLSGGTGNADLYTRFTTWPTVSEFDYVSGNSDNNELIQIAAPIGGKYFIMVYAAQGYADAELFVTYVPPSSGGTLEQGVPVILSEEVDSQVFYILDVPPGAFDLEITLSGGTGDADIYVRYGAPPSLRVYDCHSWEVGNNDRCGDQKPSPGRYYVMVHGYDEYSDVSLLATYNEAIEISPESPACGLSGDFDSETIYTVEVPEGASDLSIEISGGTGDADLYVRAGFLPTLFDYDCRMQAIGNVDRCDFPDPSQGRYYILLYGYESYADVCLSAVMNEPTGEVLSNDVSQSIAGSAGSQKLYSLIVPEGASDLAFNLISGAGDAELFVRHDIAPTELIYDCRTSDGGNRDSCAFPQPEAGVYYALVEGYSAFSDVQIQASYTPPINFVGELTDGVPWTKLGGVEGSRAYFTFESADSADLAFALLGGSGDADLYVRFGEQVSTLNYDCESAYESNEEFCFLSEVQAGTYYVLVEGEADFSGVELTVRVDAGIQVDGFESGDTSVWTFTQGI